MAENERYMPQAYAAKMRQARRDRAMRGERRIITILFCDVVGSTALAGQLDPEEWAEIMNEAFEYLITPIYRYEGTVARLMGDAILAFFGAPIAHEDDPTRAILAALAIVEGIQDFAAEIRQDYGLDFNVRVGINTGPVVVGEVGTDLALEYTAMGDAINLASRMEASAEPGHVQITAQTYNLIAPLFEVQDMGGIAVKGKEEPVQAYCVLGLKDQPGRMRGIHGLESPLIGCEPTLNTLKSLVDELKNSGKGQIVCLAGEAGLGKSRLLDELRAHFAADILVENFGWVEGRGISYDSARPYGVIMQMFRQIARVDRTDPPDVAAEKIRAQILSFSPGPREPMARALEILLSIVDETGQPEPQGEELQRELFTAFYAAWQETVKRIPLVAVHDDIQWADTASTQLLAHLFELVQTTPSLFICSFRPQHGLAAQRLQEAAENYENQYTSILLQPLTAQQGAILLNNLVGTAELPPALSERILNQAGGNPFFIEEVVRGFIASGALVQEDGLHWCSGEDLAHIEVPHSVQSLLVARIDRLEKETKQVVQLAAVIGRSFYRRVLERIVDPTLDLTVHLGKLKGMDLIAEETGAQETSFVFRQAMTRDAAYQSLLYRQRRRTHRRVAEVMELLFAGRLEEEAHQLAYHFHEARNFERALHYYRMAGDQAARLYANEEAIERYGRAIEIARDHGRPEDIAYLYTAQGRTYELGGRYEEAVAGYRALQALALEKNDQQMRLAGMLAEITLLSTYTDQFDPQQGRVLLDGALVLAEEIDDRRAQAKIYWNLMLQGTYGLDSPEQIVAYGENAVAIARAGEFREELAYALNDLARPYTQVGKMDAATAALEEAGELWRELGNRPMLADNRATLASGYRYLGRLEDALAMAQEAITISEKINNGWGVAYSSNVMGPIYLDLGRFDEAMQTWDRSFQAALQANFFGALAFVGVDRGLAYGYIGETEKGLKVLAVAIEKVQQLNQSQLAYFPELARARLYLYADDVAEAAQVLQEPDAQEDIVRTNIITADLFSTVEALVGFAEGRHEQVFANLDKAIAYAQGMGMVLSLIQLWLLKGHGLAELGKMQEAAILLQQARQEAERSGARKILWQILKALAEIAQQQGDVQQARELQEKMAQEVSFIVQHIEDAGTRQAFLERVGIAA